MPAHPDSIAVGVAIANAADDIKALDPALYDVADVLGVVEVFVVVTATSDRQLKAVVDNVEMVVQRDLGERPLRREGTPESGWVLLDFDGVVAHVFLAEQRSYYDLDRLFSDVARHDALTGAVVREALPADEVDDGDQDVMLGVPGVAVDPDGAADQPS